MGRQGGRRGVVVARFVGPTTAEAGKAGKAHDQFRPLNRGLL